MERCWLYVIAALCVTYNYVGGKQTTRLCTVPEWFGGKSEMTGAMVNGSHTVTQGMTIYFYSALKQKLSTFPMFGSKRFLYDYPHHSLYTITLGDRGMDGQCHKSHLSGDFPEICVPDGYVVSVDPHTSFGAGQFRTYGWEAKSVQGAVKRHLTFSSEMLPMFEETTGIKNGAPYFQNVFYYNTTRTSFSDDTFKVPANCPQ